MCVLNKLTIELTFADSNMSLCKLNKWIPLTLCENIFPWVDRNLNNNINSLNKRDLRCHAEKNTIYACPPEGDKTKAKRRKRKDEKTKAKRRKDESEKTKRRKRKDEKTKAKRR